MLLLLSSSIVNCLKWYETSLQDLNKEREKDKDRMTIVFDRLDDSDSNHEES